MLERIRAADGIVEATVVELPPRLDSSKPVGILGWTAKGKRQADGTEGPVGDGRREEDGCRHRAGEGLDQHHERAEGECHPVYR